MKSLIFKVSAVFVAVVSVALMGASLVGVFCASGRHVGDQYSGDAELFVRTDDGRKPHVDSETSIFTLILLPAAERGQVGSYKTAYEAITKAHEDLASQMGRQKNEKVTAKGIVDQQLSCSKRPRHRTLRRFRIGWQC